MGKKVDRPYFVYPTTPEERRTAFTVFQHAQESGFQRPQYIDDNGTVWRWDNKGNGRFGLINTNTKLARNGRDRARRIDLSLTAQDYEEAWPGQGQQLFEAEQQRINEIYNNASDSEDVDHIWSLNSGGLNVSNNLRPLDSDINRSEGDRGVPHELEQIAYMMAETKADQVRLQGPRMLPGATTRLVTSAGKVALEYVIPGANTAATAYDLFTFGRDGEELVNGAAEVVPGLQANPETDIGKRAGDAVANGLQNAANGLQTSMTNGRNKNGNNAQVKVGTNNGNGGRSGVKRRNNGITI
jgi:hypothetical protein